MTNILNRAYETTTVVGTGTANLDGAVTSFNTLVVAATRDIGGSGPWTISYIIEDNNDFEIGIGVLTDSTPDTLSRVTIKASSNSDALVEFGAGTKNVLVYPAVDFLDDIDSTPDVNEIANGPQTGNINAGMTIAKFELVTLQADGKWDQSDASAEATAQGLCALALEAGTDTNALLVALPGSFVRYDTWAWTIGAELFMGLTAGAITETKPSANTEIVRMVGHAVSADVIYFNPDNTYLEVLV